jgi:hypothetical protein
MKSRSTALVAFVSFFAASGVAHAQDAATESPRPPLRLQPLHDTVEDEGPKPDAPKKHAEERPFNFALDPTTPSRGDVGVEYGLGLASGVNADRPLPSTIGYSGAVHSMTLDYGITSHIAPFVTARMLQPIAPAGAPPSDDNLQGGAIFGMRVQLTDPNSKFRFTLAGAGSREFEGTWVGWTKVAASYDIDRVRLVGNLHLEHAFATGRDPADLMAVVGASYKVFDQLRVGAEYIGQDLEETLNEGAEGGAKHFAGGTIAVDLGDGTFQLVGGPAIGFGHQMQGNVLGKLALLASF